MKDGIYNFVNKYKKYLTVFFYVTCALVFTTILYNYAIFEDQNLSYYLFSTIVQGFLALVGFLGTVVIFKLQLLQNELLSKAEMMRPLIENYRSKIDVTGYSPIDMIIESEKILQEYKLAHPQHLHTKQIEAIYKKLKDNNDERVSISSKLVDFSVISLINIAFALLLLPVSKFLVANCYSIILSICAVTSITLSLSSIIIAFLLIRRVFNYRFVL